MKLPGSVKKLFAEVEIETLQKAFAHDDIIVSALIKILASRMKSKEQISLEDPNWTIKRAAYDGQLKEINWWINFLKEGQGGGEEKEEG